MGTITRKVEPNGTRTLTVSGGWSANAEQEIEKNDFDLLLIQADGRPISGIARVAGIVRRLQVQGPLGSSDGLSSLAKLRHLTLTDVPKPVLDLSGFHELEGFVLQWNKKYTSSAFGLPNLRQCVIFGFTEKDCSAVGRAKGLSELALTQGNLEALTGIEAIRNLRKLTLSYLPKLSSVGGVESAVDLEQLWIENCPHVSDLVPIRGLRKLRSIYVAKAGHLSDVDWLSHCDAIERVVLVVPIARVNWDVLFSRPAVKLLHVKTPAASAPSSDELGAIAAKHGKKLSRIARVGTKREPVLTIEVK